MEKDETNMRYTSPDPKKVAVAIWWLANGASYRSIGKTFGVSSCIVGRITKDVIGALVYLRNQFIVCPETEEQCKQTIKRFETLSPLPNVFGAIDGTHVHILALEDSTVDVFDRKQQYSIGIQ